MAAVNILTDIFILAMPMRAFGQLKLQRTKRIALLGVFMVGGVAVIASIVRLYALWVYAVTDDPPYDDIFILLLSQIETNAAIISAYAPGCQNSKTFSRTARTRSNGQMELYTFNGGNRTIKVAVGGTHNTSEESILGVEGITKTVDMTIEEDYVRESVHGKSGGTQGYDDVRRSDV
jgi:hypothetical protein